MAKVTVHFEPIDIEYEYDEHTNSWCISRQFNPHALERKLNEQAEKQIEEATGFKGERGGGPLVCFPDYIRDRSNY